MNKRVMIIRFTEEVPDSMSRCTVVDANHGQNAESVISYFNGSVPVSVDFVDENGVRCGYSSACAVAGRHNSVISIAGSQYKAVSEFAPALSRNSSR